MNVVALVRCCVEIKEIDKSDCGVRSLIIIKGFCFKRGS